MGDFPGDVHGMKTASKNLLLQFMRTFVFANEQEVLSTALSLEDAYLVGISGLRGVLRIVRSRAQLQPILNILCHITDGSRTSRGAQEGIQHRLYRRQN